jgi:outer membrane receptor protein involved in Fe transport
MNPTTLRLRALLGTASFLALATSLDAQAQQVAQAQTAQANPMEVPEQVLITGSLIRGTAAVGVPVTNLSPQDYRTTGALTTSDLFRTVPQFNVIPGPVATQAANVERGTRVNLRQLDTGSAPRSLMMVDGMRYPAQGMGLCQIDPSIIPTAAVDRVDLLLDGASATYGSDAIGGVINIVLKRAYDGAVTEFGFKSAAGGGVQFLASQLWGRTWDGGDITLGYNWYNISPTQGNFSSKFTFDFSPWGLDNRNPIGSSIPGTLSPGGSTSTDTTNYPANNGHNCTNCFAIPGGAGRGFNPINNGLGPTAPFSASTLNWTVFNVAGNSGTNGTRNEFNPYAITYYSSGAQYNGASVTVDQRLTKNISFSGEGFYGIRRITFLNNATTNQLTGIAIPTFNPYYPTGGAPTNLRVNYNMSIESPSLTGAYGSGMRYEGGLNIDLPGGWESQIYYSETRDAEYNHAVGTINKNAVSAALGWTIGVTPAAGTNPAVATWTRPATVPYLNLLCDPTQFQCNSPTTLNYVGNYSSTSEAFWINEKGVKADGPLFDLPGGTVKMAVGANYTTYHFLIQQQVQNQANPTIAFLSDPEQRQVWAVFSQLNVPIIGDNNALPGIRKLELEGSWRHDQYSDVGGTSNPKVAFNWEISEDLGLTVRGSWGTSFRAPSFGEFSPISNVAWNGWGLQNASGAAAFPNNAKISIACDPVTKLAPAGSGAAKLQAAGFACDSEPAGISLNGGGKAAVDAHFRTYFNQTEQKLEPELSTNYGIGFDFAPTSFLRGLDVQATWYSVKINGLLANFGNPTTNRFADKDLGFVYLVPSDVGCPAAQNVTPQLCAPFQDMVQRALAHPTNTVPGAAQTLIYWINDGGTMNKGFQTVEGVDFNASYDWDLGDFGAWNTGITGTYYLKQEGARISGGPVSDTLYHVDLASVGGVAQNGVESLPRFKYRARLGWSNGPFSVVGFMDYASHFFHSQTAPPNVNFQCLAAGGTVGGGTFPCALSNYTNIEPAYYTFDLSLGYDTGDQPANDYLKHVSLQLIVQNIMDRESPFEYRVATGGGNPCACDISKGLYGRTFQVRIVKTW